MHNGCDHMGLEVALDKVHRFDLGGVLRGDDDGLYGDGLSVLIAHGDLRLAVGTKIGQRAVMANRGESSASLLAR
mgnify:CR=1 FL=1